MKTSTLRVHSALLLSGLILTGPLSARTFVYVSEANSGNVARYELNDQTGALNLLGKTSAGGKVMPMALSADQRHLYAAVRSQPLRLISWNIDAHSGALTHQSEIPAAASYPYISTDIQNRFLLTASYDGGVAHVYRIDNKNKLTSPPAAAYPTGHAAHSVIADATGKSLYVGVLGTDRVLQLNLSPSGSLSPIGPGSVGTESGNGPRHSVISPDNHFLYNLGEMGGIITQFRRHRDGALEKVAEWHCAVAKKYNLQQGRERPAGYSDTTPRIWAADIKITPDGKFLYVTERTSSTVSGYRVNQVDGSLTFIDSWPVEKQPRGMNVTADGRWLVVSGERSHTIGSYAINKQSGVLTLAGEAPVGSGANWVIAATYS